MCFITDIEQVQDLHFSIYGELVISCHEFRNTICNWYYNL